MRWARLVTLMAVALTLSACDWGPRGQGQLTGIVMSGAGPVGAIVLEISGPGIQGFVDAGQTRVFFAELETDTYRVVLVAGNPDRVRFRVAMDDVRRSGLTATTVEAVDDDNVPITDLSGIAVELVR